MTIRIAASFLAILATGLIVAPAETSARAGLAGPRGMPMRAMPFHGGFRAPIAPAPIARPAIAPPLRPAVNAVVPRRIHAAPFGHVRHRGLFIGGSPVALWGDAPWYNGYYDPSGYVPSYQQPIYTYPTAAYPAPETIVRERIIYVLPPRPSCSTQTYRVPSEEGGVRSINIVRC
jgi:hypothetical protein